MRCVLSIVALLGVLSPIPVAVPAADLADLVGGDVVKVVGDCKFTEGPAWHPDGYLLFSDIPNLRIVRVNSDGSHSDWLNPSGGANGLMCDQRGNVYAAQGEERRVARLRTNAEGLGKVEAVLTTSYDGKPYNKPNDLAVDTSGGLYFTDPNYRQEPQSQPVQGVYYISPTGSVTRVVADLPRPNGILVSPDGKTLYVANIELRKIMAYPITGPGALAEPIVLFTGDEMLDGNGPDGMSLDEHGNLYATYKSVVVVSKGGELIGRIAVPEKPANCAFGGPTNQTLYITARTSLYSVPMKVRGMKLQAVGPTGGNSVSQRARPYTPVDFARGSRVYFDDAAPAGKTVKVELKAEQGTVTLEVPQAWEQQQPTSSLRLGQFAIPAAAGDAEPSELVVFPQFGGTVQANVDRWIQQFENQGRELKATQGECAQGKYVLVELTGTYKKPFGPPFAQQTKPAPDYKMLGVILSKTDGGNFFLKLTGPKATVAASAAALRQSFGGDAAKETAYELGE